jgi:hypothetical protein
VARARGRPGQVGRAPGEGKEGGTYGAVEAAQGGAEGTQGGAVSPRGQRCPHRADVRARASSLLSVYLGEGIDSN